MIVTLFQARHWVLARTNSRFWKRVVLGAVLTNLLGLAAFAYFSSGYWLPPEDDAFPPDVVPSLDYGYVFLWGFTALPILFLSVGLDVLWLVLAGILSRPPVRWQLLRLWLLVVGCWAAVVFAPAIKRVFDLATMP